MPKLILVTHTPTQLRSIATSLEEQASQLRLIADAMDKEKFDQICVGNNDQRRRGMGFIDSFVAATRDAIRKAREDRADHGTPVAAGKKPAKK